MAFELLAHGVDGVVHVAREAEGALGPRVELVGVLALDVLGHPRVVDLVDEGARQRCNVAQRLERDAAHERLALLERADCARKGVGLLAEGDAFAVGLKLVALAHAAHHVAHAAFGIEALVVERLAVEQHAPKVFEALLVVGRVLVVESGVGEEVKVFERGRQRILRSPLALGVEHGAALATRTDGRAAKMAEDTIEPACNRCPERSVKEG